MRRATHSVPYAHLIRVHSRSFPATNSATSLQFDRRAVASHGRRGDRDLRFPRLPLGRANEPNPFGLLAAAEAIELLLRRSFEVSAAFGRLELQDQRPDLAGELAHFGSGRQVARVDDRGRDPLKTIAERLCLRL